MTSERPVVAPYNNQSTYFFKYILCDKKPVHDTVTSTDSEN